MEYEGFKTEILKLSGIDLNCYKEKQMKRRIDSLISKNGILDYKEYIRQLTLNEKLYNEFINFLTINVSEFNRNPEQWEIFENEIIPPIIKKGNLRIWSSACSTGDEPYTVAMILANQNNLKNAEIIASDIDEHALEKAVKGVYSFKSLEKLNQVYIDRFFIREDNIYRIKDEIKKAIKFKKINLLKDKYPEDMDIIICRNVLIYFTENAKENIYRGFNKSLKPGGILFVGSTEQIIIPSKYNFRSLRTFFYKKDKID